MSVHEDIIGLLHPVLQEHGLELVELKVTRGKISKVQVFVWRTDGLPIELCSSVSRELSDLLDRKDLISGSYRLEVSSPGLDRPLKTKRDFERNIDEKVKIEYKVNDKTQRVRGWLEAVQDTGVKIKLENKEYQVIRISEITSAKIIIEI